MIMTKNEFKELYRLYANSMDKYTEVSKTLNEEFAESLIFPVFNWVEEKLGLHPDVIGNLWMTEANENEVAAVYEIYLQDKLQLLEEKLTAMEESIQ